jgi:acyl-CoA synthetase (AMP-forming)/AMP-acid ligase II
MNLTLLLDMVVEGMADRVVIGNREGGLTATELRGRAQAAKQIIAKSGTPSLLYLAGNGPAFPTALFGAAYAGVPFLPINYRLSDEQLADILGRHRASLVITDAADRVAAIAGSPTLSVDEFVERTASAPGSAEPVVAEADPDDIAVLLMTSGTTAAPKSAVLRHTHLASYILESVEFMGSEDTEATILSVPPYHIAAVANLLSNLYSGRRIIYLDQFTPGGWLDQVNAQGVTHAMVVPTMLVRIVNELKTRATQGLDGRGPATLRTLSYGGAKIAQPVLVEALGLFPQTGFVNAYGLTETASSIAVLGPEDHRDAVASEDPDVRARLSSVGHPLPTVEIEIHDKAGHPLLAGEIGDIVVRGPQVAGEYLEGGSRLTNDGWFLTRDIGYLDAGGFLFVNGRSDDTIIRGGENTAPSEIEAVLEAYPAVAEAAVAGVPDDEWGQRIVAFVVPKPGQTIDVDDLKAFVRARLRSSKTPDQVVTLDELPTTPTGKVLRRTLVELVVGDLATSH